MKELEYRSDLRRRVAMFMGQLSRGSFDMGNRRQYLLTESFCCEIHNQSHTAGFLDLREVEKVTLTVYNKQDKSKIGRNFFRRLFDPIKIVMRITYEDELVFTSNDIKMLDTVIHQVTTSLPKKFLYKEDLFYVIGTEQIKKQEEAKNFLG